ncbi:hypothetical protein RhiirC2_753076 [Rhizophagus irregularis]|uniref:Uncharacterized protein n=1 Tax=Rhizophagus irregularis TaxID=588596 RepID=A0A2N1MYE6_9GLOM|nr:hypothetical protein RhiirC2_753076 [Rhizophagus irregularis]
MVCDKKVNVDILRVSLLKQLISDKKKDIFQIKDPDDLTLWKVDIMKKKNKSLITFLLKKTLKMNLVVRC